jgi:prepilin signal peptidase PulO-like enzyme (type II secretory pathway)
MWLARRMAVMKLKPLFPYFLIGLLALSVVSLWGAVAWQKTIFVQILYVLTLCLAFGVFVASVWSTVRYALRRFDNYWSSGYPIMLAVAVLAYGVYKSAPQVPIIGILVSASAFGWLSARKLPKLMHRFIPILTITAFLIVGELPVWREIRAFILGIFVGLLVALIVNYRQHE